MLKVLIQTTKRIMKAVKFSYYRTLWFPFKFQANRRVEDLFLDLRDGVNLLVLLEALTGEKLVGFIDFYIFLENMQ